LDSIQKAVESFLVAQSVREKERKINKEAEMEVESEGR
jgi:hypothetical protein